VAQATLSAFGLTLSMPSVAAASAALWRPASLAPDAAQILSASARSPESQIFIDWHREGCWMNTRDGDA
jgi:hypothetical protein